MKLLDTRHKRKSMTLTIVIFLLLALSLIFFGLQYMDPPEQRGIAVNFGTHSQGAGNIQPEKPIESTPKQSTTSTPETEVSEQEEDILTQDIEEAPVIENKEKEKPKTEPQPIEEVPEPEPEVEPEPEPEPDKSTSDAISNLLNAPKSTGSDKGNEGDDNTSGDKGDPSGDPNASSYYGQGKGLDGDGNYNLGGRRALNKERFKQECNESGRVVVRIVVNRNGEVVSATPGYRGTTNNASCLLDPAQRAAMATKFNPDTKAPAQQVGTIIYNFSLSE